MATLTDTYIAPASLRGYLTTQWHAFKDARAKRAVYNQTVSELQALSGRELADLGIGRGEIRALAYEAAYKS